MSQHVGHCPNCKVEVSVDPAALILKASRLQCWWCGVVEDVAAYEISRPGASPQTKEVWTLIGVGVMCFGLFKLAEHLSS